MKMAVIYHSKTGNTKQMAQVIMDGITSVEGAQVKAFSIDEIGAEWIKESKCVIVGTPVYMASFSGTVKNWLDGPCTRLGLAGKICGAFATANYLHGGGEIAIQSILSHLMVCGALPYSGGGSCGKPVIHLGPVAIHEKLEESHDVFRIYGQRMAAKTLELFQ